MVMAKSPVAMYQYTEKEWWLQNGQDVCVSLLAVLRAFPTLSSDTLVGFAGSHWADIVVSFTVESRAVRYSWDSAMSTMDHM